MLRICPGCEFPEGSPFQVCTWSSYTALPNELGSNIVCIIKVQGAIMPSHGSSQEDFSQEKKDV